MTYSTFTSFFTTLKVFSKNPIKSLYGAKNEILAVFNENVPVMYVVTPRIMKKLFYVHKKNIDYDRSILLNKYLTKIDIKGKSNSCNYTPQGKFLIYDDWKPDNNFLHQALIWGIKLTSAPKNEELLSFISYWKAEGRLFHHMQWQQKFARSLERIRFIKNKHHCCKRDINALPVPDKKIPIGFRDK
ncbi:Primosomal protein 1 [Buchnera aphidicola (Thelaxes suberi)]|uniref:DnaT-like ssDNA-binding domain-containing protein n=1 Tax=Buchnera aphidicola TaxID=9 RepID=UPI00346436A7